MKMLFGSVHEPKEIGVNSGIIGEFGMESSGHRPTLSNEYGVFSMSSEDINPSTHFFDFGGSDKDHF